MHSKPVVYHMGVVSLLILILIVVTILVVGTVGILLSQRFNSVQRDPSVIEAGVTGSLAINTNLAKIAVEAGLTSSQDTLKRSFAASLKDLKSGESIGQINRIGQQMVNSTASLLKLLERSQPRGSFGKNQMDRLLCDSIAPP